MEVSDRSWVVTLLLAIFLHFIDFMLAKYGLVYYIGLQQAVSVYGIL